MGAWRLVLRGWTEELVRKATETPRGVAVAGLAGASRPKKALSSWGQGCWEASQRGVRLAQGKWGMSAGAASSRLLRKGTKRPRTPGASQTAVAGFTWHQLRWKS